MAPQSAGYAYCSIFTMINSTDPRLVAAVVYDDCVSIDLLLAAFAAELATAGTKIAGVIQLTEERGCGPGAPMRLMDVATGEILPICRTLGAQSCRVDGERFTGAAARIRAACDGEAELVFVSRFGAVEAHGYGFRGEMELVIRRERPLLTAVRRGFVHNWFELTGGVGTLLDARLWVLRNWWSELPSRKTTALARATDIADVAPWAGRVLRLVEPPKVERP